MRIIRSTIVGAIAGLVLATSASAISLDIGSLGDFLRFNGDSTFSFLNNGAGDSFRVNGITGGAGDSMGDFGNIAGTFTIGAVTVMGPVETAPVSSSVGATLNIKDGSGFTFSGLINWIELTRIASGGNLNINGAVNLTAVSYLGAETDLIALRDAPFGASAIVNFTITGLTGINQLKGPTPIETSYSGDIASVVPEGGATVGMLGLSLVALALATGLRRKQLA